MSCYACCCFFWCLMFWMADGSCAFKAVAQDKRTRKMHIYPQHLVIYFADFAGCLSFGTHLVTPRNPAHLLMHIMLSLNTYGYEWE